ncbi:MAG: hypothetical protein ABJA66_03980 [Actinomycetota bacterium]
MSIIQLAEIAIDALNLASITMHRQMKAKSFDMLAADKLILSAQRKAKAANDAYFSRKQLFGLAAEERFRELLELSQSGLIDELTESNDKFNKVLKHYTATIENQNAESAV